MKIGINVTLDVTKIEKARLFKGKKGTYLDLTTFIETDQADQYGNHGFISQSVTKEERTQNVQTPILGNCKVFYTDGQQSQQQVPQQQYGQQGQQPAPPMSDFDDDIDF
jgi:hypothetical protein